MIPTILSSNKDVSSSEGNKRIAAYTDVIYDTLGEKKALANGNITFFDDKVDSTSVCNACLFSKYHKLPYIHTSTKVVKPL